MFWERDFKSSVSPTNVNGLPASCLVLIKPDPENSAGGKEGRVGRKYEISSRNLGSTSG